ncbi:MAG: 16S rRNA (cytidine(1402)-2'-O)-methyltransferase [Candidatus Levybacteria bacterium]|nr:16S rRNA (cytidine(1402)-2'-O)-methyltransferase [Candidatus Levybacteria bacterium]
MGTLYIVATPIGNLKDITLRALEVLDKTEIIACEDTRRTGLLLSSIRHSGKPMAHPESENNKPTLLSYFEQNELKRIPQILNALHNGIDVALVSDAGTPTISDPGFKLVRECVKEGIKVESIPGPSSTITALVVSGLPTDKFLFLGFLPQKPGHRKKLLRNVLDSQKFVKSTVILFESPHKLITTLSEIKEIFGDIDIVIARELTKIHEEIRREKISKSIGHFQKTNPKGEFVILFHL